MIVPLIPSSGKADPENQVDGFLGEGLPNGRGFWSKAGWMSQARHDAAWWSSPINHRCLLVAFGSVAPIGRRMSRFYRTSGRACADKA